MVEKERDAKITNSGLRMYRHLGWFIGLKYRTWSAKRLPDAKPHPARVKPVAMLDTAQEIAIYIHRFHNLDLFQQGYVLVNSLLIVNLIFFIYLFVCLCVWQAQKTSFRGLLNFGVLQKKNLFSIVLLLLVNKESSNAIQTCLD